MARRHLELLEPRVDPQLPREAQILVRPSEWQVDGRDVPVRPHEAEGSVRGQPGRPRGAEEESHLVIALLRDGYVGTRGDGDSLGLEGILDPQALPNLLLRLVEALQELLVASGNRQVLERLDPLDRFVLQVPG